MFEWLLLFVWIFYAFISPWTKVEESFNVQAIHDLIFHGPNITNYDHLEFPGVVPRTFFGPLVVNLLGKPAFLAFQWLEISKIWTFLAARVCLGFCVFLGLKSLLHTIRAQYGNTVTIWLVLISATQFHFNFYASRPLPNIFALCPVLFVFGNVSSGDYKRGIWFATFSAFIYRSELVLLFGPIFLLPILRRELGLTTAIKHGIFAAIVSLAVTIPLDSWFWQRWLWPEAECWWYNIVLNKSHNWGTQPFLWYFYSALPRALGSSLLLFPLGLILEPRVRHSTLSGLVFVCLYSILPHKELRFIIYVIPLLNLASAVACARIWHNRKKSLYWRIAALFCIVQLLINSLFTGVFLGAAKWNYPGGEALYELHRSASNEKREKIRLHIDIFCAQTGISRFLQENPSWEYNKSEELLPNSTEIHDFDYLLIGSDSNLDKEISKYALEKTSRAGKALSKFETFHKISGFDGLKIQKLKKFPWIIPGFKFREKVALFRKIKYV